MNLAPFRRAFPIGRRSDPFVSFFDRFFDDEPLVTEHLPEVFHKGPALPLNISENEKAFSVALEVPGMDEKEINVQVMGNQLVISGEKKFEEEKKEKDWHRVERQYGSFQRSIALPTGLRTDSIEAVYKKGVLTLTIPKVEPTPAAKVKVRTE